MNPFVANFRDVGQTINILANKMLIREGMLFRGGKIEDILSIDNIGSPRVIVNLRKGVDPTYNDITSVYSPAPDSVEVYDISQGRNKKWIGDTLRMIFEADEPLPCFIHCAAGKDRTGVIVASILSLLEVDPSLIREEYSLSSGLLQPALIGKTIEDLADSRIYKKLDIQAIRSKLLLG